MGKRVSVINYETDCNLRTEIKYGPASCIITFSTLSYKFIINYSRCHWMQRSLEDSACNFKQNRVDRLTYIPLKLSENLWSYLMNPFHAFGLFLYALKLPKNLWYSDVFRVYRKRPVAEYELTPRNLPSESCSVGSAPNLIKSMVISRRPCLIKQ